MPKVRTAYVCQNCGVTSAKWIGKCPGCNEWNTYTEEILEREDSNNKPQVEIKKIWDNSEAVPLNIRDIDFEDSKRLSTRDIEFDSVLGGGIVKGSLILLGGEPGIGKSTLLLQTALKIFPLKVLYISGEESARQLKLRAQRLNIENDHCFIYTETSTLKIFKEAKKIRPDLVIIDSIQTMHSPYIESMPGSISQIRECAGEMQRFAKESNIPIFLIGHITKDGSLAGPKVLEHIVDAVLQFEGDRHYTYRILRTMKNRFGSTATIGIYDMNSTGLRAVENPSEILVTKREEQLSGIAIASMIEGIRPFLIETQALVSHSSFGMPQRTATGFDHRRLTMLVAVLEKRLGLDLGKKDVFLNIAGGIKVDDPATDLSVVASIISSARDSVIPPDFAFTGEIGLSGEVRAVNRIEKRIEEAQKLGFSRIFISNYQSAPSSKKYSIDIVRLSRIQELLKYIN
ncbi:MAG: DNA repair protein RadA [Chitinophagales bacterium]|nr:DNA repair protein RadA [Chitinophagales bacterium]